MGTTQNRARAKTAKVAEPVDNTVRFRLEGKAYEINPEHLQWGEIEELEVYFDRSYDEIDFESMRGVMFLAYLARKRVEPLFTLDDMRRLELSDLEDEDSTEKRPTDSEAVTSGSPS